MKAIELLELINQLDINEEKFTKSSLETHKPMMKKAGMRTSSTGRTTTVTSPRSNKKVTFTDTGKEIRVKRYEKGKQVGKETKSRGISNDISSELDWASKK